MPIIPKIDSINVNGTTYDLEDASAVKAVTVNNITHMPLSGDVDLGDLQEELVSGTNIKTINNNSILGSGNLEVGGGGTVIYDGDSTTDTPYDNLFMDTVASGVDAVSVGLDMDLLWENSTPTSTFSPQTISINLSEYSCFLIRFKAATASTYSLMGIAVKGISSQFVFSASDYIYVRQITSVTDSGIVFLNGTKTTSLGGTSTDNTVGIPLQIYGIRSKINDLTGD